MKKICSTINNRERTGVAAYRHVRRVKTLVLILLCFLAIAGEAGNAASLATFSEKDGKLQAMFSGDPSISGQVIGPAEIADGAASKSLRLNGRAHAIFPYEGLCDTPSGEIAFRVKLDFDPQTDARSKSNLKNQFFFSIEQGKKRLVIYTYLSELSLITYDQSGAKEKSIWIPTTWEKGEWRSVRLNWGERLELSIDSDGKFTEQIELFKPRADAAPPTVIIGSSSIDSCFSIENITIRRGGEVTRSERERFMDHFKERREFVGYPSYPLSSGERSGLSNIRDIRRTYRIKSQSFPTHVSAEEAETMAREMKEQGFNMLLTENNRNLFIDRYDQITSSFFTCRGPVYADLLKNSRLVSDACHRYGILFVPHMTCSMVNSNVIESNPDWSAIQMTTGKPLVNAYGTFTTCINNDEFFTAFSGRLENYLRACNADGLMMDEVQFFTPTMCGCRTCSAKFRQEAGFDVPSLEKIRDVDMRDTATRAWFAWRSEKVRERNAQVQAILKKNNPDAINFSYLCNNTSVYSYYSSGFNLAQAPSYCDSIGYEIQPLRSPNYLYKYYWPHVIAETKYIRSVAERIDNNIYGIFTPKQPEDYLWNWFTALSQGMRMYWMVDKNAETWKPLVAWEEKHEKLLSGYRSAANIALVFPRRTSYIARTDNFAHFQMPDMQGFTSVSQALIDAHIPYAVIEDSDLARADVLQKYKTILLVRCASLSALEVNGIREYVKNGGVLIATGDSGLRDDQGKKLDDFQLADIYGVSFDGEAPPEGRFKINTDGQFPGLSAASLIHREKTIKIKNVRPGVQVIGTVPMAGSNMPALLFNTLGKGKVIYCTGRPEVGYFFAYYNKNEIVPGKYWNDSRDPGYRVLLKELALLGGNPPLVVENIPRGVVAEIFDHKFGFLQGVVVHLANFTGGLIESGIVSKDTAPKFTPAVLPNPAMPIRIRASVGRPSRCFLFSPDFNDVVELPVEQQGAYACVDVANLGRYLMLYFSTGDIAEIMRISGGKITAAIPAAKDLVYKVREPLCGAFDPNATYVFADADQCRGGRLLDVYQDESARFIYGRQSEMSSLAMQLMITKKPRDPVLEIGGMDDNSPSSHAPIAIVLNGRTLFSGTNSFPDNAWATRSFPVPAEALQDGSNSLSISNTGIGVASSPPWFGMNYVKIREK